MKKSSGESAWSNERGIVLVVALLILATLVIIGTTAYLQTSTEVKISRNYRAEKQAFYDAEAGAEYIGKKLEQDLRAGNIDPTAAPVALNYTTPAGFSFDPPTALNSVGVTAGGLPRLRFRVVGHAAPSASRTIDVDISARRLSVFEFGFFADGTIDLKADSGMWSYDSRVTPNPTPADSTNMCDVGSNTEIIVRMNTVVDGDTALGEDVLGVDGIWTEVGTPIINGDKGTPVDRVDPDPLGARGGDLANKFTDVILNNDNALATGTGMSGSVINVGNAETLTLVGKPGGADYYITSLTLKNGATLNIDASAGPVNVYLSGTVDISEGDLEAKTGASINSNGNPTDFKLFSNSSQDVIFKHNGDFRGMIYAPYSHVEIKNSADAYGLVWGGTADIKNGGEFYFDTALKDLYPSNRYEMTVVSWWDVRAD